MSFVVHPGSHVADGLHERCGGVGGGGARDRYYVYVCDTITGIVAAPPNGTLFTLTAVNPR